MFCFRCGGDADEPNHREHCDGQQGRVEAEAHQWPTFEPFEHVRATDPDTSHAAAQTITDATEVQRRVYAIHAKHPKGLTDEELVRLYAEEYEVGGRSLESRSSPRKRRSDLTNAGLILDSGERRALASGRNGVVWKLATAVAVPA